MKSGKREIFEDEWNDSRLIIQSAIVRKSRVPFFLSPTSAAAISFGGKKSLAMTSCFSSTGYRRLLRSVFAHSDA